MERDYGTEIDALRDELKDIKALLTRGAEVNSQSDCGGETDCKSKRGVCGEFVGHIQKMPGMHSDPALMQVLDRLENTCGKSGDAGRIAYLGVYSSGGRQSTWIRNEVSADDLLELIENRTAEKVLACIGSSERLGILLAILKKPMTVSQLVDECGYNSTGQVYHHLKPLIAADLVTQGKHGDKGSYIIQPHRVQGIIMLLAGISDMVDPEYTKGEWTNNQSGAN